MYLNNNIRTYIFFIISNRISPKALRNNDEKRYNSKTAYYLQTICIHSKCKQWKLLSRSTGDQVIDKKLLSRETYDHLGRWTRQILFFMVSVDNPSDCSAIWMNWCSVLLEIFWVCNYNVCFNTWNNFQLVFLDKSPAAASYKLKFSNSIWCFAKSHERKASKAL